MNAIDEVRANTFDQWVGEIQTNTSIQYGTGNSLLDVGCGIGMYTPMFLNKFKRVVGLDPSEEYLKIASKNKKITWVLGYGETFKLSEKFDTINMTMLLEHVDKPEEVLRNCKRHLKPGGKIIAHVPNSLSITRRLGVLMGVLNSSDDISEKERKLYGHKRTYTTKTLYDECVRAGLEVIEIGGVLYKPLPNEMLLYLCEKYGKEWKEKFLYALTVFGTGRSDECANLYVVCQ